MNDENISVCNDASVSLGYTFNKIGKSDIIVWQSPNIVCAQSYLNLKIVKCKQPSLLME